MQTKAQIIDSVLELNPSATREWLDRFEIAPLRRYLDHLHHALDPRGHDSYWIRDAETPAVVTRNPAA